MVDQAALKSASTFHSTPASSSNTAESRQNVLIRNAIASDSQRIRVQDESTGKSYELHLGKGAPYPKRYGGDDTEDYSFEQEAPGSSQRLPPPATLSKNRPPQAAPGNGHTAPSTSTASSSAHRVLRLPMIVRHRGHTQATANGATQDTTTNESVAEPTAPSSPPLPYSKGQALPRESWSGSSNWSKASETAATEGNAHLQELNRKYHESLAATSSSNIARQGSRDSSRASRETVISNGIEGTSPARMSSQKTPSHHPLTAPTRHYPIMSELPPSPPLEEEVIDRRGQLEEQLDENSRRSHPGRQRGASPLSIDTAATVRQGYYRQTSNASTSSAYISAQEDVVPSGDEGEEPVTPKAKTPTMKILHCSPGPIHSSPPKMQDAELFNDAMASPLSSMQALHQTVSGPSSSDGKKPRANTGYSPSNYLHPASALPNSATSPSRRSKGSENALRQQPSGRSTTGSSVGSGDSGSKQKVVSDFGQERSDTWISPRTTGAPTSPAGQSTFLDNQSKSTSTVSAPGTRALRTGDAGFDEELAKAEASIRKRLERQRRDEEDKALAAQQAEQSEAFEREQLQREREKERERERGGGSGGIPALMRAKSNLNKLGGVGVGSGQTSGQGAQSQKIAGGADEEKAMVVGNIINEGHVNYIMMYNMLTGIRIGVSRCQAKLKRPLTYEDYQAKHKFTFDIIGNELTPSAKYDFKFKDYAPWVFRELREYFHLDPADYLLSLTAKYILSELGSPGKSGSFFYFSRDYRFIIKTIRHSEHKFLLRILKDYHEHVKANPHTLLSRFYGLHRVKLPHGRKIHFVIMNNLFPPHRDIHETYDLKGSSYGREYPEEKAKTKKGATLKDINWIRRRRELELGPEKRALFAAQLASDVALLKKLNIMDYSLLIGLHDMRRGNSENLRQEKLQIVQPEAGTVRAVEVGEKAPTLPNAPMSSSQSVSQGGMSISTSASGGVHPLARTRSSQHSHSAEVAPTRLPRKESTGIVCSEGEFVDVDQSMVTAPTSSSLAASVPSSNSNNAAMSNSNNKRVSGHNVFALRAAVRRSDPKALGSSSTAQLPAQETSERRHFLFYQDEGGFRSTGENNEPGPWIYYLGIIDLFTPYSSIKRGENWWKTLTMDGRTISAVPPRQYGNRFVKFLKAVTRPIKLKDLPPGFDKVEPLQDEKAV